MAFINRFSTRAWALASAAAFVVAGPAFAAPAKSFEIQPQSLSSALEAFGRQSGAEILFDRSQVSGRSSPGVRGTLTPRDALVRLIQGSGARIEQPNANTFVVSAAALQTASYSSYVAQPAGGAAPSGGAEPQAASDNQVAEVVVTGTLLRGVAPAGANVLSVSSADVVASGANSANQVLSRVPQVTSNFNQVPALTPLNAGVSVVRPSLRNIGAAGGNTTLVLIDGHRAVPAGILQTSPDPDAIPPGVLERVEVVPDGGSAIYGSDAVAGVINFITRKRFDGVDMRARYGFADGYHTFDSDITVGRDWGSGSAYLSWAYANNDAILGRDRGYARQVSQNAGFCAPGTVNVTVGGVTTPYALPGRVPNTRTSCDNTDQTSIVPAVKRNSLFGRVTQDLTDKITFDATAFYSKRVTDSYRDLNDPSDYAQAVTVTSANPYYVPIGPNDPGTQTVNLSYLGVMTNQLHNTLEEYGVTPSLTVDLGKGWQLRALTNFGHSEVVNHIPQLDSTAQSNAAAGTTIATALDPYDVAATNPAVLRSIIGTEFSRGVQNIQNARVILDGTPVALPGGDLHVAGGLEFYRESLENEIVGTVTGKTDNDRTVKSVFGEVSIPIVGTGNAMPGVSSLVLSASGRYDDYSDFGGTFNPKFGLTYKPVEWISLRGNWGKSFNAPSLADTKGAPDSRAILLQVSPFSDPRDPASVFNRPSILIAGGNPNLGPQHAKNWSFGFDISPPVAPGLKVSATYYGLDVIHQIAVIPFTTNSVWAAAYAPFVIKNPTLAQATAEVGALPLQGATSLASLYGGPNGDPYVLLDLRRQNLGELKQKGIDFNVSYTHPTDFGSVNAGVGGSYTLSREIAAIQGAPFSNDLESPGASRLNLLATVGATVGAFTGSATLSHTSGFDIDPALGAQNHVDGFSTVDLFFAYDLHGPGLMKNLQLTLNVNNVFDASPPFYNQDPGYYTAYGTVGRLIQFGIADKF